MSDVLTSDNLFGFVRLTYLNGEATIPSWFSSSLLLACAAALGAIAMVERGRAGRDARHWLGLAVIFVVLSLDEGAGIHEISSGLLRRRFELDGFLRFASVIPLALAAVVVGVAYLRFLWRLPSPTRGWFVLAGAVFVGGAVGVESLGANYFSANGHTFGYSVFVTIEEAAEMVGLAVFLYALLDYLGRRGGVRLLIRSPTPVQQD